MRYNTPIGSLSPKYSKMSSSASDEWTEVDGSSSSAALDGVEVVSGSDEDDESNTSVLSSEDYESRKMFRVCKTTELGAKGLLADRRVDPLKLATLTACRAFSDHDKGARGPDVDDHLFGRLRRSTLPSPRAASLKLITPRRTRSMLSSIRNTIRGKLSYASGEARMIRQSSVPTNGKCPSPDLSVANSLRKVWITVALHEDR